MKAGLLLTGNGAMTYLTSHTSFVDEELIAKFEAKGIGKFIACEIPLELAKERYGRHYGVVLSDLRESDDLRILDYEGCRAFTMFSFQEMGTPFCYESGNVQRPLRFGAGV
jgi:hypothetical protein